MGAVLEGRNDMSDNQYAVICKRCGVRALTEDEYDDEMLKCESDWTCPTCGGKAEWDDDCLETRGEK